MQDSLPEPVQILVVGLTLKAMSPPSPFLPKGRGGDYFSRTNSATQDSV